jgi:hypothetical protein
VNVDGEARKRAPSDGVQAGKPDEVQAGKPEEVQAGKPEEVQAGKPEEVQAGKPEEVQAGKPEEVQAGKFRWNFGAKRKFGVRKRPPYFRIAPIFHSNRSTHIRHFLDIS